MVVFCENHEIKKEGGGEIIINVIGWIVAVIVAFLLFPLISAKEKFEKEHEDSTAGQKIMLKAYSNAYLVIGLIWVSSKLYELVFGKFQYDTLRFIFDISFFIGCFVMYLTVFVMKKRIKSTKEQ
jgi:small-conductance mechanosensitive channel